MSTPFQVCGKLPGKTYGEGSSAWSFTDLCHTGDTVIRTGILQGHFLGHIWNSRVTAMPTMVLEEGIMPQTVSDEHKVGEMAFQHFVHYHFAQIHKSTVFCCR